MSILFVCGSARAYEACEMTSASMKCMGRGVMVESVDAGTIRDCLGIERLVILDDIIPHPEMMDGLQIDGIKWVIRSRDRLSGMAQRKGYFAALTGCTDLDDIMYAHVDEEICGVLGSVVGDSVWHLPDVYSPQEYDLVDEEDEILNVGCFGNGGNVIVQAAAAIMLGRRMGIRVSFHFSRCDEVEVENIKGMFQDGDAGCVIHREMDRGQRCQVMSLMDVGIQVGIMPEKNIVSDYVKMGIPVVTGTPEEWLPLWTADTESPEDICSKAEGALRWRVFGVPYGRFLLGRERGRSMEKWDIFLGKGKIL